MLVLPRRLVAPGRLFESVRSGCWAQASGGPKKASRPRPQQHSGDSLPKKDQKRNRIGKKIGRSRIVQLLKAASPHTIWALAWLKELQGFKISALPTFHVGSHEASVDFVCRSGISSTKRCDLGGFNVWGFQMARSGLRRFQIASKQPDGQEVVRASTAVNLKSCGA